MNELEHMLPVNCLEKCREEKEKKQKNKHRDDDDDDKDDDEMYHSSQDYNDNS